MGYENFSVEDFAADHDFVRWVRQPDSPGDLFWQQWMMRYPHKRAEIEQARLLVKSVHFPQPAHSDAREEPLWQRIEHTNETIHYRHVMSSPARRSGWWKVAAVVVGLLSVVALTLYTLPNPPAMYATNFGETKEIELPDGSQVVLNANSALRLGATWQKDREVWLEGEAFFSIKKKTLPGATHQRVKFTVHTNTVDVNVLGTEFTVAERNGTRVVLNSGKITLTLPDEPAEAIHMKPGDMVEIMRGEGSLVHRTVNPSVYSAWKDRVWILDGLTLDQVAGRITETYGVPVEIYHDADAEKEVSGVVPTSNLDAVLEALSTAFERSFVQQQGRIIIK